MKAARSGKINLKLTEVIANPNVITRSEWYLGTRKDLDVIEPGAVGTSQIADFEITT